MRNQTISTGDTAWVLTSTGLVYLMTPALSCFYGGLVESKHFYNQLFLGIVCMGIVPVQWCLFGYSFAFGPGNAFFGSFDYALLRFMSLEDFDEQQNKQTMMIPSLSYVALQCSFAIMTSALISGAVVGRMKLIPYMIFIFLWSAFCYNPLARWVFAKQGWLHQMGTMDFAGGLVVHLASGISGLVAAIILGFRTQFDPDVINTGQTKLPFTILGTGLLWVGWMGFNGGSALAANHIASLAIVNSNIAAATSMIAWIILNIIVNRSRDYNYNTVSIPGACSGIVVGLVVMTPGAGLVQPGYAVLIGLIGGILIFFFILGKKYYFHIDDSLDVFSCHGLGGFIGTFLTGVFSQTDVNSNGSNGAIYGRSIQLWYQLMGILIVIAYSAACTAAILLPMHYTIGIRINRSDQIRGLDSVAHGVVVEKSSTAHIKLKMLRASQLATSKE